MKITHSSPVLISKSRKGLNKYWQGHYGTDGTFYYTFSTYWQDLKGGGTSAVQQSEPYQVNPKNVGKMNETTDLEQARSEFDTMVTKYRDKGYRAEGEEAAERPLPMLAQKWVERKKHIQFPAFVQPKLNGMRMLMNGTEAWSRGGKDIIPECVAHLMFDTKGYTIDGELMLPNNVKLQETMKAAKKYREGVSEQLRYFVYDIVAPDKTFAERAMILKHIIPTFNKSVVLVSTVEVYNASDVMAHHVEFTSKGFEGTMIRNAHGKYEVNQRSNHLQKFKDFVDGEFIIKDVIEGDGSYKGCAIFICNTEDGVEFRCNPEGDIATKQEYFNTRTKHIGKYLTIRYQELSNDGVPLFPVGVDVREKGDF
jgi:ATP-dependent DNA ligase